MLSDPPSLFGRNKLCEGPAGSLIIQL